MFSSVTTIALISLSLVLVTADNSMPMPFELSIADERAEACRHRTKEPPEKVTPSNATLCFAGLKEDTDSRLHWRIMSASLRLKNMTLLVRMKVRRVLIFAPGATFRLAGGNSVPVFSIMKDLQLVSNFNGYGVVSGPINNSSAIFEGQLNSTVFGGRIIYQNMSRSHKVHCFHNNTLKPEFYRNDSCLECIVFTYNTRRHTASPVGWRSSNLPLCKDNGTSAAAQDSLDTPHTQLHGNRSTEYYENEEEDSSGFPKTGFSDYRKDLSHRVTETQAGANQNMRTNTLTTAINNARTNGSFETTGKPPENDVNNTEVRGQTRRPSNAEESFENTRASYIGDDFAVHPGVKISDDEETRNPEPSGDTDNRPKQETVAVASDERERGQVSDQLTSQVRSNGRSKRRSAKSFYSQTESSAEQVTQSTLKPKISKAETSVGDEIHLLKYARLSKEKGSVGSESDTLPDVKPSRKPSPAISSRKARSVSQKSSRKRQSVNENYSSIQSSSNQNPSRKQHSASLNTSRKRHSANQKFARRTRRSAGQTGGAHSSDDSSFLETVSCSLHLVADHLFFNEMGDRSTAKTVNLMLSVVIGADAVFRATDFDGDGVRDNIGFLVKNITIIHNASAAFYGYSRTNGNSFQYLRSFSTGDFSDVCLGVAFTAIDFDRGVVGLAWYASSLSGGAGACFRRRRYCCCCGCCWWYCW